MRNLKAMILFISCAFIFVAAAAAATDNERSGLKTTFKKKSLFEGKSLVEIETISGNCVVKKGISDWKIEVEIKGSCDPEHLFKPQFSEKENRLVIQEVIDGSNTCSATWTIIVPKKTDISFSSASGELKVAGLKSRIFANTASGSIDISDCSGRIDISSASGDIVASRLNGEIQLETASGDIEVHKAEGKLNAESASGSVFGSEIRITEMSAFTTASGDVNVMLNGSPSSNLTVSSASGKAVLNYKGNPISGYFEFTARVDKGRIKAPFKFDKEEEFDRDGTTYITKSFTKGTNLPEIYIETASGTAVLEEN
ncbi:MAG: DUF4097 family beta strand repeat-containing protein [candidate division Zixibacteria bacterium]|nr:DUF4097 family beta strand repeat-containing protein [candidate division Zixibacteria bacterium]